MKRASIALLLLVLLIFSCGKKESDLIVIGHIKGLKKGTVYLEQLKDTALVVLDSVIIKGEAPFELHSRLEEPEVLYLLLDKNSADKSRITFFADKGITEINTTLKRFVYDAKIKGSKQQEKLEEFNRILSKFNAQSLDLIKAQLEARQRGDLVQIEAKNKEADNLLKRKYLYAINFAINNKDNEIAPYIALSEIFDANTKYLDTIYNSLSKHVVNSKYGKALDVYIKKRKQEEKK